MDTADESVYVGISEMRFTVDGQEFIYEHPLSVYASAANPNTTDTDLYNVTTYVDIAAPKTTGDVLVDFTIDWDTTYLVNSRNLFAKITLDNQTDFVQLEPDQGEQTSYFSLPLNLSNPGKGHNLDLIITYGQV